MVVVSGGGGGKFLVSGGDLKGGSITESKKRPE